MDGPLMALCVTPETDTSQLKAIYPKPLDLEEEKVETQASLKHLQTATKLCKNDSLDVGFFEKNTQREAQGKPPLKNIVPFDYHVMHTMNFSRILGAFHAVLHHTNSIKTLHKGIENQITEVGRCGLSRKMKTKCLRCMVHKTSHNTNNVSTVFTQQLLKSATK